MCSNLFLFQSIGAGRDKSDSELLRELEDILQPKIPVAQRCKVLKELCESDKINKLEDVSNFYP